jgi:hypothetical protein
MIGSTDSHTGIAAAEETAFAGKGQRDDEPEKRSHPTRARVVEGLGRRRWRGAGAHPRCRRFGWPDIAADGRATKRVGNTVDVETGEYTNSIGAAELTAAWTDPDFDPNQPAFYYVRALEIPTPRYSLLDAIKLGIDVEETRHPATIQERVYSSPSWYTP